VAVNRLVDAGTATEISSTFVEVVLAPDYSGEALTILKQKKNLRLLKLKMQRVTSLRHREIDGGFLVQDKDAYYLRPEELKIVTKRAPTAQELRRCSLAGAS